MKNFFLFLIPIFFIFLGCESETEQDGESEKYEFLVESNPDLYGHVLFQETVDGYTNIRIEMEGTQEGEIYSATLNQNNAAEGGELIVALNSITGDPGVSETEISNIGKPVTYEELTNMDAHIRIFSNRNDSNVLTHVDIGSNALTDVKQSYNLQQVAVPNVGAVVTFHERKNGFSLIEVDAEGTTANQNYPIYMYQNSVDEGGDIILSLNQINPTTGISYTNVEALNDGTSLTYEQLVNIDGHIKAYLNSPSVIFVQGNVGANTE